jgi:hypothetical protein
VAVQEGQLQAVVAAQAQVALARLTAAVVVVVETPLTDNLALVEAESQLSSIGAHSNGTFRKSRR